MDRNKAARNQIEAFSFPAGGEFLNTYRVIAKRQTTPGGEIHLLRAEENADPE